MAAFDGFICLATHGWIRTDVWNQLLTMYGFVRMIRIIMPVLLSSIYLILTHLLDSTVLLG